MISVRLPHELEQRLEQMAASEKITKSEIIKEALSEYFRKLDRAENPYLLGEDLFGNYGSDDGTLSRNYKKIVRDKIHAKKPD